MRSDGVYLSNGHIVVDATLADKLFGQGSQVDWVYYPHEGKLMMAAANDETFRMLYKTKTALLKIKNLEGDRSMSVQELLLDEDISPKERKLSHTVAIEMGILNVWLG